MVNPVLLLGGTFSRIGFPNSISQRQQQSALQEGNILQHLMFFVQPQNVV